MITISLCMIVKNESKVLGRCLDSVRDAVDEIVIVDTGSSDSTKDIASLYTDKIYDFKWINDFAAARNESYSKASMDYQMWLDADDVLTPGSLSELLELKKNLGPGVDIVTMKYIVRFDGEGKAELISTRERLTRREKGYLWQDPVHECIPLDGKVFYSGIEIHHKKIRGGVSYRNLNIYGDLEKSGKPLTPRQMYYFARELKDHGMWAKAVYYFERFLDCGRGWLEDNISACLNLSFCYETLGDRRKILPVLIKSFEYDSPRADICSEIGYYYKRAQNYETALKWFELAAALGKQDLTGFVIPDYYGYIPNIESCVCCCELGDFKRARQYNESAAGFKPDSEAVSINREYLNAMNPPPVFF